MICDPLILDPKYVIHDPVNDDPAIQTLFSKQGVTNASYLRYKVIPKLVAY